MFTPLTRDKIKQIVVLQVDGLKKMLLQNNIHAEFTEKAINYLAEKSYEPQYGARPIKRVLQKKIINELSKAVLANSVETHSEILIGVKGDAIVFKNS